MAENAKQAWSEVGERFTSWGRRVADRYHEAGSTGKEGADEEERELKRAAKELVDELSRGFSALGSTVRDDQAKKELADAVSAIGDAITATVEETAGAIRSRSGGGKAMNLNSILIGSEDPKRLVDYYGKLFGKPVFEGDGYTGWELGTGWITVGPHSEVKGKNTQPGRLIWNIETPDVKGEFERLKAAGATVVKEPYEMGEDPVGWIATFSDPDDNYFQLLSPM